jgi:hypothetical protein
MHPRIGPCFILAVTFVLGCPPLPEFVTCEEATACGTTQFGSTTSDGGPPTTSDGVQTVTGDEADASTSSSTAAPDEETGADTTGTTGEAAEPPLIISRVVMPDYTDVNALLLASVTADHADGVRMLLDNGALSELSELGPGEFGGTIEAFTGLDNGPHKAVFTPWRTEVLGEPAEASYVIALPKPGSGIDWDVANIEGVVAAIAILLDGRPVEFLTVQDMGVPRCYLRRREKNGDAGDFVPVLAGAHCTAIDMTIDRETGVMHLLLERKSGDGLCGGPGRCGGWGRRRRTSASARSATPRSPWRAAPASSRSAARRRWRRATSATRSLCCSATASMPEERRSTTTRAT